MSTSRPRAAALVPLVAVLIAGLLAGCGAVGRSAAATVNGQRISEDAVDDELVAVRDNQRYREAVENEIGGAITGDAKGTFDAAFASRVVTLRIYFALAEQFLREEGVEIGDRERAAAEDAVVAQVGGPDVFDSFPEPYQRLLLHRRALIEAVDRRLGAEFRSDEAVEDYYDENRQEFAEVCVRHILVDSRERAGELRDRIQGGADFGDLARAESTDPGSGQEGGDLGCRPRGSFVQEFEDVAFSIPEGEVSEPVQSPFGWHLILVEERRVPPLEEVRPQVEQRLSVLAQETFTSWLSEVTREAEVDVNPRYGEWVVRDVAGQPVGQVVPPEGPTTTVAE